MFKKFTQSFQNEQPPVISPTTEDLNHRPCYPFSTDYMNALPPRNVEAIQENDKSTQLTE